MLFNENLENYVVQIGFGMIVFFSIVLIENYFLSEANDTEFETK